MKNRKMQEQITLNKLQEAGLILKPKTEHLISVEELKEKGLIKLTCIRKITLITAKDLLKNGLIKRE